MLVREVVNFGSFWRSTTFSSTVEPTIYLLAFGFGFGALVSTGRRPDYVEFVGTGTVATAVLFSSVFPAMFGTFVKYQFQRTYDAILAAPVDTEELVTGEALWIAARAGTYGCVPLLVAMVFGLDPSWGMLIVPFIAFLAGFGWASLRDPHRGGHEVDRQLQLRDVDRHHAAVPRRRARSSRSTSCPSGRRSLANLNPLYHCVELVRHAVFGFEGWIDLCHVAVMVVVRRSSPGASPIARMERKLID